MELYRLGKSTVIDLLKMGIGQIPTGIENGYWWKRSHSIPPAIQLFYCINTNTTDYVTYNKQ